MNIYLISDENDAKRIGQLLKLNAECVKLHWSKTFKDLTADVYSALETLEGFVEKKIYEVCTEETRAGSLNEDEESEIIKLLRQIPELRATLGTGVVMVGEEAESVLNLLKGKTTSKELLSAVNSGKNVVLF